MFGFEGIGYNDKNLFLHFSEIRKDEHVKKLLESCNIQESQLTFTKDATTTTLTPKLWQN